MRVLVCVKRVPITGGRMVLTDDAQALETKHLGFTISPHEECGVEEAVRIVEGQGGEVVVLTLGPGEAEEQLRDCMAIGADRGILLKTDEEWDAQATASAIVDAVRGEEPFDLLLFGNESADAGNYQVGIRVAYALGLPVVTGLKKIELSDGRARVERDAGGARDVYEVALPAVLTVLEGLNLPRYPSVPGRSAREVEAARGRRAVAAGVEAREAAPRRAGGAGQAGGDPRPWRGRRAEGGRGHATARCRVSVLLFVEPGDDLSWQALTLARGLGDVRVVSADGPYAPAAWAAAIVEAVDGADAIVAAGSDRGNELLAHVAARLDQPFAANVTAVDGDVVTRIRWGGSLLEEARLHGSPKILTVAPHTQVAAAAVPAETLPVSDDGSPRVLETVSEASGGVSLRDAKVVVSGGRGVGSSESFDIIEELAGLLGGAVGCSRVVTSAGWRPHTDQVGQTGTKISADLYVACGISGATQHIAGAKGAKKILAINSDPEAPILASADYAVIGDLHEIVPAISAELRKVRGS